MRLMVSLVACLGVASHSILVQPVVAQGNGRVERAQEDKLRRSARQGNVDKDAARQRRERNASIDGRPFAPTGGAALAIDFGAVEYFPNLKSKVGLANSFKDTELLDSAEFLEDLGPGLLCANLEFDYWYKWPDDPMPMLEQQFETSGDPDSRPIELEPTPGEWLASYETEVGDRNVRQLIQLTGAPAQFQVESARKPAVHPAPTDIDAAMELVARWAAAENHAYPILWSLWNEPVHTLTGFERGEDMRGGKLDSKETKAAFERRLSSAQETAAEQITELFGRLEAELRPNMGVHARLGLASFLSIDFQRTMPSGRNFFAEVFHNLGSMFPDAVVDHVTFNSFNGLYWIQFNGARAVAGAGEGPPFIITQYSPRNLRFEDAPDSIGKQGVTSATPLQVAGATLSDISQFMRATDVEHACISYWIGGGEYGFLTARNRGMQPNVRYQATKLFMQLPVLRTSLDFGDTGLDKAGLRGLAGINAAKAAVLLWNEGDMELTVPLAVSNLPENMDTARVSIIAEGDVEPSVERLDGDTIVLPPHAIALVEFIDDRADDPLLRRYSLSGGNTSTKFLSSRIRTDRMEIKCTQGLRVDGSQSCIGNTGTFGVYDSVRSVANLGKGRGSATPTAEASFQGLPTAVHLSSLVVGSGSVRATASFEGCDATASAEVDSGYAALDLSSVPSNCRRGAATLMLELEDAEAGGQAEVYLSADRDVAEALVSRQPQVVLADDVSVDEQLVVRKESD